MNDIDRLKYAIELVLGALDALCDKAQMSDLSQVRAAIEEVRGQLRLIT